jgi:hypothetical protein
MVVVFSASAMLSNCGGSNHARAFRDNPPHDAGNSARRSSHCLTQVKAICAGSHHFRAAKEEAGPVMDTVMSQPLPIAAAAGHGWEAYCAAARSAPSQSSIAPTDIRTSKTVQKAQDADRNS